MSNNKLRLLNIRCTQGHIREAAVSKLINAFLWQRLSSVIYLYLLLLLFLLPVLPLSLLPLLIPPLAVPVLNLLLQTLLFLVLLAVLLPALSQSHNSHLQSLPQKIPCHPLHPLPVPESDMEFRNMDKSLH